MKVQVTLKSPDCLDYAKESIIVWSKDKDDEVDVEKTKVEQEKLKRVARKWFECGEYLMVEIDTEKKSIRVLEI